MKGRLRRFLDPIGKWLFIPLIVLLYLAVLAGRDSLGKAYAPVVVLLAATMVGLILHWLQVNAALGARLRVDAPVLLLGGLLLLALGLRLLLAPKTAPSPGTEEAYFVQGALEIIHTGKYIPASLRHPSLLVYVELAASILRFIAGASANLWTWPTELAPEHLYGWARGAVALLGTATIVPIYWLGKRRYGQRIGLLAAFFLALLPMHVAASGIVTPETVAGLLSLLTVCFSLRLFEERRPCWALAAGMWAGLTSATHYPAALVLLVPLLAAVWPQPIGEPHTVPSTSGTRRGAALLVLLSAILAFALACPAVIFDLDRLVAGMAEATRAYFPLEGSAGTGLRYLLQEGLGYGPFVLCLLGAILLLPRLRRQEAVLFSFPAITYLALLLPRARFLHDLVLLAPWLALVAAYSLDQICAWVEKRWPDRPQLHRWLPWGLALLGGGLFLLALF